MIKIKKASSSLNLTEIKRELYIITDSISKLKYL